MPNYVVQTINAIHLSKCRDQLSLKYLGEEVMKKVESKSVLKGQVRIQIRKRSREGIAGRKSLKARH